MHVQQPWPSARWHDQVMLEWVRPNTKRVIMRDERKLRLENNPHWWYDSARSRPQTPISKVSGTTFGKCSDTAERLNPVRKHAPGNASAEPQRAEHNDATQAG